MKHQSERCFLQSMAVKRTPVLNTLVTNHADEDSSHMTERRGLIRNTMVADRCFRSAFDGSGKWSLSDPCQEGTPPPSKCWTRPQHSHTRTPLSPGGTSRLGATWVIIAAFRPCEISLAALWFFGTKL